MKFPIDPLPSVLQSITKMLLQIKFKYKFQLNENVAIIHYFTPIFLKGEMLFYGKIDLWVTLSRKMNFKPTVLSTVTDDCFFWYAAITVLWSWFFPSGVSVLIRTLSIANFIFPGKKPADRIRHFCRFVLLNGWSHCLLYWNNFFVIESCIQIRYKIY